MRDVEKLIGQRVMKFSVGMSPRPFKSGNIFNTVKGITTHLEHPEHPLAFTFFEDDSYVECSRCIGENEYPDFIFALNVYKSAGRETENKKKLKSAIKQLKNKIKEEIKSN